MRHLATFILLRSRARLGRIVREQEEGRVRWCWWLALFPFYWGEDPNLGMVLPTFRVGLPYSVNPSCKCPHRPTKGVFHPDYKIDYFVKNLQLLCDMYTHNCMHGHAQASRFHIWDKMCLSSSSLFSCFLNMLSPYSPIFCRWYNFILYNKLNIHCMYIKFSLPVCMLMNI